jgi:hypothetical protein
VGMPRSTMDNDLPHPAPLARSIGPLRGSSMKERIKVVFTLERSVYAWRLSL